MQANAIAKHGKFAKYKDKKIMWDELYFGIVPFIAQIFIGGIC